MKDCQFGVSPVNYSDSDSEVIDWTLSYHLDLSFISEFILDLVLMKKTFIQFSLAYFYYMLQIYSDVSLTLFRTCDSDYSHSF